MEHSKSNPEVARAAHAARRMPGPRCLAHQGPCRFARGSQQSHPFFARAAVLVAALALLAACKPDAATREGAGENLRWVVAGRIEVPRGLNPAGVFVYAEGTSYLAVTDENGEWAIAGVPPGAYRLRAQREDLSIADLGRTVVPDEGPAEARDRRIKVAAVTLAAKPLPREGRPQDERPAYGALRGVIHLAAGATDFDGVIVEIKGTELRTVTNPLGEYYFAALAPGKITLIFSRRGWAAVEADAEVRAGVETAGPIVELRPAGTEQVLQRILRGEVAFFLAADGSPEPNPDYARALISLEGTSHIAAPDAQGRFFFEALKPGAYNVIAFAPGYKLRERVAVDLTDLETADIRIELDEDSNAKGKTGTLRGVALFETPPVENDNSGIIVSLLGTDSLAVTDFDGAYEISGIPEGLYILRAQAEGFLPEFADNIQVRADDLTSIPPLMLARHIEPPRVLFTDPADGQRDVPIRARTTVTVRFSKQMSPPAVKSAVTISPSVAAALFMGREHPQSDFDQLIIELAGAPSASDKGQPANLLRFRTTYTVTIGTQAADFENAQLEEPYSFSFTTGDPLIIASRPAKGDKAASVFPDEPIVLYMNAPMDHESFRPDDISFRPEISGQVRIQPFDNRETGWTELRIYASLKLGEEYRMEARGRWRTSTGESLRNMPYQFEFGTARFTPWQPNTGKPRAE